jgi:hypothetical protein
MTLTAIAIANGVLALLVLAALAAVFFLGLRMDETTNEGSVVPAGPTPLDLHLGELARAA